MTSKKKTPAIPAGKKVVKNKRPKKPVFKSFENFLDFQPDINAEATVRRTLQIASYEYYKELIAGGMSEKEALAKADVSRPTMNIYNTAVKNPNTALGLKASEILFKHQTTYAEGGGDTQPILVFEQKALPVDKKEETDNDSKD